MATTTAEGFPICHDCHDPITRAGNAWRHVNRATTSWTCSYASYNAPRPFMPGISGPIPNRDGRPEKAVDRLANARAIARRRQAAGGVGFLSMPDPPGTTRIALIRAALSGE